MKDYPIQKQFIFAICTGNYDRVAEMVQSVGVDTPDKHGSTSLHYAAINNKVKILALLLAQPNVKVDQINTLCQTALDRASGQGHKGAAKLLIKAKANVNSVSTLYETPLHRSIESRNNSLAELLLKSKANPNGCEKNRYAPIHLAAISGNLVIVKALIAYRADPDVITYNHIPDDTSPWSARKLFTTYYQQQGVELFDKAVRQGKQLRKEERDQDKVQLGKHTSVVKLLLNSKADPNLKGKEYTPLHMAAVNMTHRDNLQDIEIIKLLVSNEADHLTIEKLIYSPDYDRHNNNYPDIMPGFQKAVADGLKERQKLSEQIAPAEAIDLLEQEPKVERLRLSDAGDRRITSPIETQALLSTSSISTHDIFDITKQTELLPETSGYIELIEEARLSLAGKTKEITLQGLIEELIKRPPGYAISLKVPEEERPPIMQQIKERREELEKIRLELHSCIIEPREHFTSEVSSLPSKKILGYSSDFAEQIKEAEASLATLQQEQVTHEKCLYSLDEQLKQEEENVIKRKAISQPKSLSLHFKEDREEAERLTSDRDSEATKLKLCKKAIKNLIRRKANLMRYAMGSRENEIALLRQFEEGLNTQKSQLLTAVSVVFPGYAPQLMLGSTPSGSRESLLSHTYLHSQPFHDRYVSSPSDPYLLVSSCLPYSSSSTSLSIHPSAVDRDSPHDYHNYLGSIPSLLASTHFSPQHHHRVSHDVATSSRRQGQAIFSFSSLSSQGGTTAVTTSSEISVSPLVNSTQKITKTYGEEEKERVER